MVLEHFVNILIGYRLRRAILEDFGKRILELPTIFEKGWRFPLDEGQSNEALDSLASKVNSVHFEKIHEAGKRISQMGDSYRGSGQLSLAVRLHNHYLKMLDGEINYRNISNILRYITILKMFGTTAPYIASKGNLKFAERIPVTQMSHLLEDASKNQMISCKLEGNFEDSYMLSPECVGSHAVVENTSTNYSLRIKRGHGEIIITITDSGSGICYKDGEELKPLPPERMPEIFKGFTTEQRRRGEKDGLGLQVAKAIAELRGGHVEVRTRTGNEPYVTSYRTTDRAGIQMKIPYMGQGTAFTLRIPE